MTAQDRSTAINIDEKISRTLATVANQTHDIAQLKDIIALVVLTFDEKHILNWARFRADTALKELIKRRDLSKTD